MEPEAALEPALSRSQATLERLSSPHNARLRGVFALNRARERRDRGLSLLEGSRFVLDCLRLRAPLVELFLDESLPAELFERLVQAGRDAELGLFRVAPGVLQRLSDQGSAEGVAATVLVPEIAMCELQGRSPLVVCHNVQNPGNLGAIVRVAAALGAGGVIGSGGSDPYGPKALRGAAGATFALPVVRQEGDLSELCRGLRESGYRLIQAEARGGQSHRTLRCREGSVALLLGGEGAGFAGEELPPELAAEKVSIALRGPVESLNVAVAAGMLLDRLLETAGP